MNKLQSIMRWLGMALAIGMMWTTYATGMGILVSAQAGNNPSPDKMLLAKNMSLNPNNSLTTTNPAIPDPLLNANVADGIIPTQYPECNFCSPTLYQNVTGCPNLIGTSQECQGYCHVPSTFTELYSTDPPTSGNHYPIPWAQLGQISQPIPRGRYIHSMEHGAVIFVYNCALDAANCTNNIAVMGQVVDAFAAQQQLVIMTPDPALTQTPYAVMSWTWLHPFTTANAADLTCFVQQHAQFGRECNASGGNCVALIDAPMTSVLP